MSFSSSSPSSIFHLPWKTNQISPRPLTTRKMINISLIKLFLISLSRASSLFFCSSRWYYSRCVRQLVFFAENEEREKHFTFFLFTLLRFSLDRSRICQHANINSDVHLGFHREGEVNETSTLACIGSGEWQRVTTFDPMIDVNYPWSYEFNWVTHHLPWWSIANNCHTHHRREEWSILLCLWDRWFSSQTFFFISSVWWKLWVPLITSCSSAVC